MRFASLVRQVSTAQGTPGLLQCSREDGRTLCLHTLELPWKDNQARVSCIPAGMYRCAVVDSAKFGAVYGVERVPGRSNILIHAGNTAGDTSLGFLSDVQGCILVGQRRGEIGNNLQSAVLGSRVALKQVHGFMGMEPFELTVSWAQDRGQAA